MAFLQAAVTVGNTHGGPWAGHCCFALVADDKRSCPLSLVDAGFPRQAPAHSLPHASRPRGCSP